MATGAGRGARAWFRGGDRSSVAQSIASRRRGSRGCEAPAPLVPAPRSHRERQLGCSARARTGRLRYQAHRGWLAGDTRAAGACSGRRGGARWTAFTLYGLLARDQLRWHRLQGCTFRCPHVLDLGLKSKLLIGLTDTCPPLRRTRCVEVYRSGPRGNTLSYQFHIGPNGLANT